MQNKRKFVENGPQEQEIKKYDNDDDDQDNQDNRDGDDIGDNSLMHACKLIKTEPSSSSSDHCYQDCAESKESDDVTFYSVSVVLGIATYGAYEMYDSALPVISSLSGMQFPDINSIFSAIDVL